MLARVAEEAADERQQGFGLMAGNHMVGAPAGGCEFGGNENGGDSRICFLGGGTHLVAGNVVDLTMNDGAIDEGKTA